MVAINRRSLLKCGTASLAFAALHGISRGTRAAAGKTERKLILIFGGGGWDTTYSVDPKPGLATIDAPAGREERFGEIRVWTGDDRPCVAELFRRHGSTCAVVNGVQMMSFVHPDCWKRILTGTASDSSPDLGAITAYEHASGLPVPYLVLGRTAYTGELASVSARVGSTKQIVGLLDAQNAPPSDADVEGIGRPTFSSNTDSAIRKYVLARAERERAVRGQSGYNRRVFRDFLSSLDRASALARYRDDLGGRAPTLDLTAQRQLAVKALERGLSQSVIVEQGGYDTHSDNTQQAALQETLFAELIALLDELSSTPGSRTGSKLLDETTVVFLSEMGRTPKLNSDAGKDHWPVTSALLFGAGVRGGRAYGASSDGLEALNVDFDTGDVDAGGLQLLFSNLAAGVLELVGVDSEAYLPGVEVFRAFAA